MNRIRKRLPTGAKARAQLTVKRLAQGYPDAYCALVHNSPYQLLVATILSAQCTDQRVNLVTPEFFAKHPNVESLAGAKLSDIENIIRSTGFYRAKAQSLVAMAQDVVTKFGGVIPQSMEELTSLRGVGRKTANVILGVAFDIPGLPVDTHVTRLSALLKLTAHGKPVEIERDLCAMVDPSEWTNLSLRLILHGRKICIARRPKCSECVLNDFCPSAGPTLSKSTVTKANNRDGES